MQLHYQDFLIRDWELRDRPTAAAVIGLVLTEYGLTWEPTEADRNVLEIEACYQQVGGEFWVVEQQGQIVGTAAYYPIHRSPQAVEIRKMYLLPTVRGQGLGRFLLQQLEQAIAVRGFHTIWIETASVLKEAVQLYLPSGYRFGSKLSERRCSVAFLIKRLTARQ